MTCRGYNLVALVAALILATCQSVVPSPSSSPSEYEVKAAFIYNFAKFVEWPDRAFSSSDAPLVIGIIGDDPFGSALDNAVKGKTANGRRLVIKRLSKLDESDECHIVFVCSSEEKRLSKVLDKLNSSNILTIGEMERFTRRGGMIGFVTDDSKVGFEVNLGAAKRADLKISSKLLKLAKNVRN